MITQIASFNTQYITLLFASILIYSSIKAVYKSRQYTVQLKFPTNGEDICALNGFKRRAVPKKIYAMSPIFNELQLLGVRLHTLNDVIEKFAIVEGNLSFSNNPKPLYYLSNNQSFSQFHNKIVHVVSELDSKSDSWKKQEVTRCTLIQALDLAGCQPDDLVLEADIDELPDPDYLDFVRQCEGYDYPVTLQLRDYYYDFECQFYTSKWFKVKVVPRKFLSKDCNQPGHVVCPEELRDPIFRVESKLGAKYPLRLGQAGWHMSFFFDIEKIKVKLNNYLHTDRNTPENNDDDHIRCLVCKCRTFSQWDFGVRTKYSKADKIPKYVEENFLQDSDIFLRRNLVKDYCLKSQCY